MAMVRKGGVPVGVEGVSSVPSPEPGIRYERYTVSYRSMETGELEHVVRMVKERHPHADIKVYPPSPERGEFQAYVEARWYEGPVSAPSTVQRYQQDMVHRSMKQLYEQTWKGQQTTNPEALASPSPPPPPKPKKLSIRERLQRDTDEWLSGVKITGRRARWAGRLA